MLVLDVLIRIGLFLNAALHQRRRKIGRWAAQMLRGGRSARTDLLQQSPAPEVHQKEEGKTTRASNDGNVDNEDARVV